MKQHGEQITKYQSIHQSTGVVTSIYTVLNDIKYGRWSDEVKAVRKCKMKKADLPVFSGSGIMCHDRSHGLMIHNGHIIIDIDCVSSYKAVFRALSTDKYVAAAFRSAGGNGMAVVFKIDSAKHKESFRAIADYLGREYDLNIDKGAGDKTRLRFVSYDPNMHMNLDAEVFEVKRKPFTPSDHQLNEIRHALGLDEAAPEHFVSGGCTGETKHEPAWIQFCGRGARIPLVDFESLWGREHMGKAVYSDIVEKMVKAAKSSAEAAAKLSQAMKRQAALDRAKLNLAVVCAPEEIQLFSSRKITDIDHIKALTILVKHGTPMKVALTLLCAIVQVSMFCSMSVEELATAIVKHK